MRPDSEGGLDRLRARLAAVSAFWAAARTKFPRSHRRQVRHVFHKCGLTYDDEFSQDLENEQADRERHALQGKHSQALVDFAEMHLDLPVAYEAVSPTHAVVVAGFARACGRSCVVFAIAYGEGLAQDDVM